MDREMQIAALRLLKDAKSYIFDDGTSIHDKLKKLEAWRANVDMLLHWYYE